MPEPDKAPPLPRGLIVKTAFGPHRVGAHIDDSAQVKAVWMSTQRHKVAKWDGGAERKAEMDALAAAKAPAKPAPAAGTVA